MKALSLSRPWTTLVLHHGKGVENRTWTTGYRGELVVHGAQSFDRRAEYWAARVLGRSPLSGYERDEPTGLLGMVELVDVCTAALREKDCDCGPWAMEGQAHWRLVNPRPFAEPIPCGGKLGLWTVPEELLPCEVCGFPRRLGTALHVCEPLHV